MDLFQETALSGSQFKPPALPEVYVTVRIPGSTSMFGPAIAWEGRNRKSPR